MPHAKRARPRLWALLGAAAVVLVVALGLRAAMRAAGLLPPRGVTMIALSDTAAYSAFSSDVQDAIARCKPPACTPIIWRGPKPGEIWAELDSAGAKAKTEFQATLPPGGQAYQDSAWTAFLSQWDTASKPPLLLVDSVVTSFAEAKATVSQRAVWGFRMVPAAEAEKLSSDPRAANGALVITTWKHAPKDGRTVGR